MTQSAEPSLHRILRVRDGLAVTVGIVIGAGILRTPGIIAGYVGEPWLILLTWLVGGLVAALSTIVLAEMSAALPHPGGKYVFAREAWGPTMGFVAGWSELLVTRGFSGAVKAVVIAEYTVLLLERGSVPILAGAVVLGFYALHTRGLRASTTFQNVTTIIKVLVILLIAAAGIWAGDWGNFGSGSESALAVGQSGLLGFALAYQAVAFAYYGWEDAAKMAGEIQNPGRSLPRILVGGAAAVAALYLLINIAFIAALTPAEMAGSELVAQDAIVDVFGGAAGTVVVVASLLILISSANVNFLGLPRVAYGLAKDGLAFRAFARLDEGGTPRVALTCVSLWIGILAVSGTVESLINYMMMVAISVDTMVLAGHFRLRSHSPSLERPFRVPAHPWIPAITVALYVAILAIIIGTQPTLAIRGGGIVVGLTIIGAIVVRRTGLQKAR